MILYIWNRLIKKLRGKAVRDSKIHNTAKVEAGSTVINSNFGKYSYCGYDCKVLNCSIGAFCSIADGVVIGNPEHPMDWVSMSPVFYKGRDSVKKKFAEFERMESRKTEIANDVWIGERVFIKAGVSIGNGAVIGMGSVVTHDVPAYEIWAGNPARCIRKRFDDETINALKASAWWKLDDTELEKYAQVFNDVPAFVHAVRNKQEIKNGN